MACENLVSVKNIMITFYDCDTDTTIGPIAHELATEELPMWKTCAWSNEKLVGGYTKRRASDVGCELKVIRDLRVPLSYYQGCAALNMQVEYDNGLVYTGRGGGAIGDAKSDTHQVDLDVTFRTLDELLPAGALAA